MSPTKAPDASPSLIPDTLTTTVQTSLGGTLRVSTPRLQDGQLARHAYLSVDELRARGIFLSPAAAYTVALALLRFASAAQPSAAALLQELELGAAS